MAGFDGRCPHCNHDIGDKRLHSIWTDHDYSTSFEFDCEKCERSIEMTVHSVPEFELQKAETPEEYQARRAELMRRINAS
jgi:hypothetical protein